MGLNVTADSAASAVVVRWTTNTLALHLLGAVNQDRNASGSIANKHKQLIRESGYSLWMIRDWSFRTKIGTLTTAAGQAYAALATDFAEFRSRYLRETPDDTNDTATRIRLTGNIKDVLGIRDRRKATDTAVPLIGCPLMDTSALTFAVRLELAPTPDAIRTYRYAYVLANPWTHASLGDDDSPVWPVPFNEGWRLGALWRIQHAQPANDAWKDTKRLYDEWLQDAITENDEFLTDYLERLEDGYDDLGLQGVPDEPDDQGLRLWE